MKTRFSTEDIVAIKHELQHLVGMRVNQVYDVDTKTYLLKLNRYEEKVTLLLESGIRIHTTEYEWPKNPAPSGFSMKLRKHIRNKRLEKLSQLGTDRIVDLQFGINDAAYHLILEMYDKGNLVFTDWQYTILNILRPRTDKENTDVKFVVRERYPVEGAAQRENSERESAKVQELLRVAKDGENLRKILLTSTGFGPALLDHVFLQQGLPKNPSIGKQFNISKDLDCLIDALREAQNIVDQLSNSINGYVIQKEDLNPVGNKKLVTNIEFHPFLFRQYELMPHVVYPSFDKAVDFFFSSMEAQKIESKTHQREREAMKKLENVKKDHEKRLNQLIEEQVDDVRKAELIESNLPLVEKAIAIIRSAIANQISWDEIWDLVQEAVAEGDPIAKAIKKLKLEMNHFTILLNDPFDNETEEECKPVLVDIDLDLSAYGNARKYYDRKRHHAKKEQKTLKASEKAFKNAEKKTMQTLKEAAVISQITKARKQMWFEKFIWFISSENYLVIAGRDIQQNEVIVKRYMKANDIYVHADIHGASSVVIKNPNKTEISPKTLSEAGTLSVCYSAAWDAKVLTNAWWVYSNQVSKTAPTGEYLTAGSFMIRGKKNYLLPSHLILGFGFLFKLDDDSLERHAKERRVKMEESETSSEVTEILEEDICIEQESSSEDDDDKDGSDDLESKTNVEESDAVLGSESAYPDTKVNLPIFNRSISQESGILINKDLLSKEDDSTTLVVSSNRRVKQTKFANRNKVPVKESPVDEKVKEKSNANKRGQKGKLKKIKAKYKDQDEEERELRMKILASAGESQKGGKKKKKGKESLLNNTPSSFNAPKPKDEVDHSETNQIEQEETKTDDLEEKDEIPLKRESSNEEEEDEDEEEDADTEEQKILNSLTGQPMPEDTLIYAVPVCAPYSAMQSYKYKLKMMPGTGRRGKAAKTALNVFLHDKTAGQREKDCLRSVKDQDISRNFPGKVKIFHSHIKKK